MTSESHGSPTHVSRSVDRLINFTDAVVAVAATLLALPLVDIAGPEGDQTMWDVVTSHAGEIGAFLFTFYVVLLMWLVHNRILNSITSYDGRIFWLNTTWLVGIVLLPWVSNLYGGSAIDHPSVGTTYWILLALISLATSLMSMHLHRNPRLLAADAPQFTQHWSWRAKWRGPVLGGYFVLTAIVWPIAPAVAAYMPFGIIPLSIWLRPVRAGTPADDAKPKEKS